VSHAFLAEQLSTHAFALPCIILRGMQNVYITCTWNRFSGMVCSHLGHAAIVPLRLNLRNAASLDVQERCSDHCNRPKAHLLNVSIITSFSLA
jgi:hypothetical protein